MAVTGIPGWGQTQPQGRFALTVRQVAPMLTAQGIQIGDEQISLPANVVATEPSPLLDVLSVGALGDQQPDDRLVGRSWVKLACHQPGTCLPFYVIVTLPESAVRESAGSPNVVTDAMSARLKAKVAITMPVGAHATLVMDDNRSHIQVSVISLENGVVGHRIRVASEDRKQTYVAEVVSASLLKRSF